MSVLNCLYDSVSQVLRKNVERRALCDNLDIAMLALDEICDNGIFMECEPADVVSRVALRWAILQSNGFSESKGKFPS